jgi:hypothetical protein
MNSKWEYHTITFAVTSLKIFKEKSNELGAEGWELVSMVALDSKSIGSFDSGSATSALVATFKRIVV